MTSGSESIMGCGNISNPSQNRVRLSGNCGYSINIDTVHMFATKITNTSLPTGLLKLVLWALSDVMEWSGTRVAEVVLAGLDENAYYEDLLVTATRYSPPDGNYVIVMSLEACQDGRFTLIDSALMNDGNKVKITSNKVSFIGKMNYELYSSCIIIKVERISHNVIGGTGPLLIILEARSKSILSSEASNVYKVAEVSLNPLQTGYSHTNVDEMVLGSFPPEGYYYMLFSLMHWENGAWRLKDIWELETLGSF